MLRSAERLHRRAGSKAAHSLLATTPGTLARQAGLCTPGVVILFRFDIDISCRVGLWKTAASVLDGYIKAEGVLLQATGMSLRREPGEAA